MRHDQLVNTFEVPIEIYFSNKNTVSIPDIIKSLEALDTLTKQFHTVVGKAYGLSIESSSAAVETMQAGSLSEDIIIKLFFKDEKEFEKFVNKFGNDHPMIRAGVLFLFVSFVLYTFYEAATRSGGDTTHIEANNNVIININQPGLTGADIASIIDKAVIDKKASAKAAVKLVAPASTDKEAFITFKNSGEVAPGKEYKITPETIAEVPKQIDEHVEEKLLSLKNAVVTIRATDLDKRNQGWGGIVEGIERRLPITISPTVDISQLKDKTFADVVVFYKRDANSTDLFPVKIYIENLASPGTHTNLAKKKLTQAEAEELASAKISSQLLLNLDP